MAALPPAGVSLQAQGFNEYIRRLDAIEKKNREVFDAEYKGTQKSFSQVTAAAKKYERELRKLAAAEKKAQQEAKKLAAAQKTAAAAQTQAFISTGQAVLTMAGQIATATFELGKLGAQFQGQQVGLRNLAASYGQSGREIQRAIQQASRGALSGLDAIQAANQGLLLGVAKTPEEFANLTSSALTLGRTLGLDATQSIEQFTSALGRQSLLILDNFGISAKQVNAEIERLAKADFGVARAELTEAQKQATFMKAALNIAGEAAATIGEEAGKAQEAFDRLTSASEDLKTELGIAVSNLNQELGITDRITKEINKLTKAIRIDIGFAEGATLVQQIDATEAKIGKLEQKIEDIKAAGEGFLAFLGPSAEKRLEIIGDIEAEISELETSLKDLNLKQAAEDAKTFNKEMGETPPIIKDNTEEIKALQSALKQAETLQLSFARSAEDAALKQSRAIEDIARKRAREEEDIARNQAKAIANLQEKQVADREKLLKNQQKRLDKFEKSREKQVAKAENDIAKARKEAANKRREDQRKLQRDLQREREKFNLSQLQSERRFALSERRLRAAGDILALQQLREDRELERKEEAENFALSQKDRVQSAEEQQREQTKDLDNRVNELKANLEDQRAELLKGFDEQLAEQQKAQATAQAEQQKGFAEQAAERTIALSREEEDRKLALEREEFDRRRSQARQLEDLGRSLAEQKEVTAQGVNAIADEIENVFGMDGVATNIISGFSARSRSEFDDLASSVKDTLEEIQGIEEKQRERPLVALTGDARRALPPATRPTPRGGIAAFQEGGVVPGPIGSPQIIQAHGGETVLPTHQSFTMAAPVIPTQSLDVNMSGGFNITGDGQADDAILQAAAREMTDNFRIAVRRLARRN